MIAVLETSTSQLWGELVIEKEVIHKGLSYKRDTFSSILKPDRKVLIVIRRCGYLGAL